MPGLCKFSSILYIYVHVCSVVSISLQPPGLLPARLLCPWDSPGKNTKVDSHSFSKGHKIFLSNPERREMAALPLYTNGRNLFCSHPLCMEWSLPLIREFLPALLALPVGLGVRDWQCILLYGIGCINKELFSLTQGPILQQYPCIWNTKTRHVEKHSRLFTGFDRATCPHWEWSFFFIFASLMGENCLLTVFCFLFFFNLNAYI